MKYLCLIYDSEKTISQMSKTENDAFMGEYFSFTNDIQKSGHLMFNEGYATTAGTALTRPDLSGEAIRLGRLIVELQPDPEAIGLLALMVLHESRRAARTSDSGDLVLLDEQDRRLWDRALIVEGQQLVQRALASRRFGPYTLQAAIAAVHADARTAAETDWARRGASDVAGASGRAHRRRRDSRPWRTDVVPLGARRAGGLVSSTRPERRGARILHARLGPGETRTGAPVPRTPVARAVTIAAPGTSAARRLALARSARRLDVSSPCRPCSRGRSR